MRDEIVEVMARGIATSKARYTAGSNAGEDLIEVHYDMPSTSRYAHASIEALESAGFTIVKQHDREDLQRVMRGHVDDYHRAKAVYEWLGGV